MFGADRLDVAVSGGPDSTALLALAVASGRPVTAHHVDHALRPGSGSESEVVGALCDAWGAEHRAYNQPVDDGADLEARCRAARQAVLPRGCLKGHTADDQAETVLLRLIRGTGPGGLAAMDKSTHPILGLRRRETAELCDHLGVTPLRDPMNDLDRFTRNRVRSEVLPLLGEIARRDVVPLLVRAAELAGEQADLLGALADGIDPTDAAALSAAPGALAAEALRSWWRRSTPGLLPPDRAAVDRMLEVVRGEARACDVAAGWTLRRTSGRLRLDQPGPRSASQPLPASDSPPAGG